MGLIYLVHKLTVGEMSSFFTWTLSGKSGSRCCLDFHTCSTQQEASSGLLCMPENNYGAYLNLLCPWNNLSLTFIQVFTINFKGLHYETLMFVPKTRVGLDLTDKCAYQERNEAKTLERLLSVLRGPVFNEQTICFICPLCVSVCWIIQPLAVRREGCLILAKLKIEMKDREWERNTQWKREGEERLLNHAHSQS